MAIRAVLFDLDGTLYDRGASLRAFLTAQYAARADLLGAVPLQAFIDKFIAYDANGSVQRDVVYPRILSEIGGDPSAAPMLVADYVDGYGGYCRPPADLFPTLERLRGDGLRLGVVTNGQVPIQERTLAGLGLMQAFDAIVISENEGIRKPDPEIFLTGAGTSRRDAGRGCLRWRQPGCRHRRCQGCRPAGDLDGERLLSAAAGRRCDGP